VELAGGKLRLDHPAEHVARLLLEKGANPNIPVKENTLTRTIFTMQWFYENGATAFIRAAQSAEPAPAEAKSQSAAKEVCPQAQQWVMLGVTYGVRKRACD
jgi:hypothetical protein